jgi:hypothetical protein
MFIIIGIMYVDAGRVEFIFRYMLSLRLWWGARVQLVDERVNMLENCLGMLMFSISARLPVLSKLIDEVAEPPCSNVRYNGIDVKLSDGIGYTGVTMLDIGAPLGLVETGGATTVYCRGEFAEWYIFPCKVYVKLTSRA